MSPNGEDKHHERDFRYPQPIKWQSVQRNTLGVKNPKTFLCQPLISALQAGEPAEGTQVIHRAPQRGAVLILVLLFCYSGWVREGGAHPFVLKKLPNLT